MVATETVWEKRWNTLKNYMKDQSESSVDHNVDDILSFDEVLHVMKQVEEMEDSE